MPAKKYEFVPKKCAYCGKDMERKRFPKNNRLEDVSIYNKRKYCDRMCMRKAFLKQGEDKGTGNWASTHATARRINNLILHKTECEICGKQGKLDVHHKDENPNNNEPDNLQVLCRSCHMKIHHPKPICKVPGCENQVKGYGYCGKHYIRYKKYGNPYTVRWNTKHTKFDDDVKYNDMTDAERYEIIKPGG